MIAAASSRLGPRPTNQDAACTASWAAIVADGVGGGPAGDLASAAVVHRLAAGRLSVRDGGDLLGVLRVANWELRAHTRRDPALEGMATTLTGLVVAADGGILLAHSGDSRAYRLRDGAMTRQTRDDSFVQELVEHGLIGEDEALSHPRRNIVTASLGGHEDDGIVVRPADARVGDRWLLCSDGVTDCLPETELPFALGAGAPAEAAAAVAELALAGGSHDNVTAVVCDVSPGEVGAREEPSFHGAAAALFCERLDDVP